MRLSEIETNQISDIVERHTGKTSPSCVIIFSNGIANMHTSRGHHRSSHKVVTSDKTRTTSKKQNRSNLALRKGCFYNT